MLGFFQKKPAGSWAFGGSQRQHLLAFAGSMLGKWLQRYSQRNGGFFMDVVESHEKITFKKHKQLQVHQKKKSPETQKNEFSKTHQLRIPIISKHLAKKSSNFGNKVVFCFRSPTWWYDQSTWYPKQPTNGVHKSPATPTLVVERKSPVPDWWPGATWGVFQRTFQTHQANTHPGEKLSETWFP